MGKKSRSKKLKKAAPQSKISEMVLEFAADYIMMGIPLRRGRAICIGLAHPGTLQTLMNERDPLLSRSI
jgi:hypothetical protein